MVEIKNLRFRYEEGDFSLGIDYLKIAHGEKVAIVGPSGSGKTTLLNLIAGIAIPDSGNVNVSNTKISALQDGPRRNFRIVNVGLIFQEFELLEYLNVLDNILLAFRVERTLHLDTKVRSRAVELAKSMGIGNKLTRYANHLSQGEKQRVAVCRALLLNPPLLLADEPTGNLDPLNKHRVLDALFDSASAYGATLITVTHDREILDRFQRVIDFKEFCVHIGPAS